MHIEFHASWVGGVDKTEDVSYTPRITGTTKAVWLTRKMRNKQCRSQRLRSNCHPLPTPSTALTNVQSLWYFASPATLGSSPNQNLLCENCSCQ